MALRSILFIIIGAIYLFYPTIFNRLIWPKAVDQNQLFAKRYTLIMRILGGILIAVGIILAL